MYCRNCGTELSGNPAFCFNCGAKPLSGASFCQLCGASTGEKAEVCTNCGARLVRVGQGTWMSLVAGILSIIAGVLGLAVGGCAALVGVAGGGLLSLLGLGQLGGAFTVLMAVPLVLAVIAIVGGVYALRRTNWGLALAGSICAIFSCGFVLGVAATVLAVLGRDEFV